MYYTGPAGAGDGCTAGFKQDYEDGKIAGFRQPPCSAVEPKRNLKCCRSNSTEPKPASDTAVACDGSLWSVPQGAYLSLQRLLANQRVF
jgi:hypothetical protein